MLQGNMAWLSPNRLPQASVLSGVEETAFGRFPASVRWAIRAGLWAFIGWFALGRPGVRVSHASGEAPPPPAGSEYLLRAWGAEDGLPENSATAIVQTQDHYLWFGTFNGLVRFNGHQFKVLGAPVE